MKLLIKGAIFQYLTELSCGACSLLRTRLYQDFPVYKENTGNFCACTPAFRAPDYPIPPQIRLYGLGIFWAFFWNMELSGNRPPAYRSVDRMVRTMIHSHLGIAQRLPPPVEKRQQNHFGRIFRRDRSKCENPGVSMD